MVAPKAGTLVGAETPVELVAEPSRYVSRGGDKLAHALQVFGIDVKGARTVDLGSSTGGFTDCLLQAGAAAVVAVDVGYGQLDFRLREDERVTVLERTNVRLLDSNQIAGSMDLVVADLSFISLTLVMDVIAGLVGSDGEAVVLVKPQFEVGRDQVSRGGVVDDPDLWRQAIDRVMDSAARVGLAASGLAVSPLRGAVAGNREFLLHVQPGTDSGIEPGVLPRVLDEAQRLGEPSHEPR